LTKNISQLNIEQPVKGCQQYDSLISFHVWKLVFEYILLFNSNIQWERCKMIVKSLLFFILAGICEIGGGYLVWVWLREGKNIWFGI